MRQLNLLWNIFNWDLTTGHSTPIHFPDFTDLNKCLKILFLNFLFKIDSITLDPDPDKNWAKILDPDPKFNVCGSATLVSTAPAPDLATADGGELVAATVRIPPSALYAGLTCNAIRHWINQLNLSATHILIPYTSKRHKKCWHNFFNFFIVQCTRYPVPSIRPPINNLIKSQIICPLVPHHLNYATN